MNLRLSVQLRNNMEQMGFQEPTLVQRAVIPAVLSGNDVVACAQAGSGKTAAFLIPIVEKLSEQEVPEARYAEIQEPYALLIAPTRQSAEQIHEESLRITAGTQIKAILIHDELWDSWNAGQLRNGCHIVISLQKLQFLVFDQADRMLHADPTMHDDPMNAFDFSIHMICAHQNMPLNRQTLMFSTTFPGSIPYIAKPYLREKPTYINAGLIGGANDNIKQTFLQVLFTLILFIYLFAKHNPFPSAQ